MSEPMDEFSLDRALDSECDAGICGEILNAALALKRMHGYQQQFPREDFLEELERLLLTQLESPGDSETERSKSDRMMERR